MASASLEHQALKTEPLKESPPFDYDVAFCRNRGVTNATEQDKLRRATVAVAGVGGVGGDHLIALARAGVGNLRISDLDDFDLANFNRQYGATVSTIGRPKLEVMAELTSDINPEAKIQCFEGGVTEANVDAFLDGADVFVDAIEFFEVQTHRMLANACRRKGIPVVFAVPLGFGAGVLVYTPEGMSFDDYFDIDYDAPAEQQALKMALGCAPSGFHVKYLDPAEFDLGERKAPSISCGCKIATGIAITQALLAILHPTELKPLPHYVCFDARLQKLDAGKLRWGNRNPLQKLKFMTIRRMLGI